MTRATSLAVAGATLTALFSRPSFREFIAKWSGYNSPGGIWRILAILLALANLKNLPFVWHLRFFRAFCYQLYLQPTPIPPRALFQPIITASRTPLLETDYNLHKSNSTYFSDMDISRTHLFTAIIRNAIQKSSRLYGNGRPRGTITGGGGGIQGVGATQGTRGKHMIALGGIACNFKREILPYARYEMWTRLLCWDRKWFFLLTHLVKPGVARPRAFSLQPWRRVKNTDEVDREKLKEAVFATAIAKYVIKRGRITVPPETALVDAEMVPVKPEGWVYKGEEDKAADVDAGGEASLPEKGEGEIEEWNWDVIERERLRGLKFAESFAALDGLHDFFDGGKDGALGEYADLVF